MTPRLDFDFNAGPDPDGLYRVSVPDGTALATGDEVEFGIESDGMLARGIVQRVYSIAIIEHREWLPDPEEPR